MNSLAREIALKRFAALFGLALVFSAASAQPLGDQKILTAELSVAPTQAVMGGRIDWTVAVTITPGLHINSHSPLQDFLIPTDLRFLDVDGVHFHDPVYPAPELKRFAFSSEKLSVYENRVMISGQADISLQTVPGKRMLQAVLSYQGCNDQSCFIPQQDTLQVEVELILDASAPLAAGETPAPEERSADSARLSGDEARAAQILQKGLPYALAAFFLVGLALNLTPCVYPIIPITVSYFGGQSGRRRSSILGAALFYLLGIALSFAALGLLSSLAGRQWGFMFASPWFVVAISAIMILMAASMFGAFEITVPSFLLNKFGAAREGVIGSLVMGLTVGVIIAPCAAGIIIGLVTLVARMGLVVKGGLLFFAMGLGLGLPYLVLAVFSGLLQRLPQSGEWMVWIKKLFGFLLLGVAFYFLAPQMERISDKFLFLAGITGLVGGLLLGWFDHTAGGGRGFKLFKQIVGVLLLILGLVWIHHSVQEKTNGLSWNYYSGQSMEEILASGKPIFIDFYADWCAPCKQLDRETFSDSRVQAKSEAFYFLKVDCTKPDAATQAFMSLHQVAGMPTLIFIKPDGQEITELREIGYIDADRFLANLAKAL
ncbi:MAG TPA: cytochrome c biogenesis protein CcdA [bacterium]|nr:cytochrome c biogenesis protein CcdA [bacterium]HPN34840.1 cytochrome c biogenesis protein CcdA [bacterium]